MAKGSTSKGRGVLNLLKSPGGQGPGLEHVPGSPVSSRVPCRLLEFRLVLPNSYTSYGTQKALDIANEGHLERFLLESQD